ncbi:hypothetical protein [Streptomyces nanshensis]|uniref:hypothetical protein n=1 Tax=Streptomyces nanshensis TaxID=518642 RepID=UPI000B0707F3|nr:hypothetical protein [Streptomyces nanshensis]
MATYPAIEDLDLVLDRLGGTGEARRRQLRWVRGELQRALDQGALPVTARRSLRRMLEEPALGAYVRLAESGALRQRIVAGGTPPTTATSNAARLQCLDLLRETVGLPVLHLGSGAMPLREAADASVLTALRRQLDQYLGGPMSPGLTRLTALLAVELDTAARSGELAALRTTHLAPEGTEVYIERRPQHGTGQAADEPGEWITTSALTRAALERWLPVRHSLVQRSHGTSKLWVSLRWNHTGVSEEETPTIRPPGMPLEENGLISSYRRGRQRYTGLRSLLPPKLERLRRAVEAAHQQHATT